MNEHLKRSRKQEKRGATILNGTRNSGSGNGPRKNDVRTERWSVEYKTTTAASYSLKLADLRLAERHAILEHRTALFGIDFAGGKGGTSRFIVVGESDLHELLFNLEDMERDVFELREQLLDAQAMMSIMRNDGS